MSVPPPPSRLIATESPTADASIAKLSLPLPPDTERLVTEASGRVCAAPSTVTTRFVPSEATKTVCAASESDSVHAAAGGESPLLVFAFGSGAEPLVPAGADVAPSDCVAGVVPATVPVDPPLPVPGAPVAPVVPAASGPSPGVADVVVEPPVCVGPVTAAVVGAGGALTPPVDVPTVAVTVVVVGSGGADKEAPAPAPTTAVSGGAVLVPDETGAAGGATTAGSVALGGGVSFAVASRRDCMPCAGGARTVD